MALLSEFCQIYILCFDEVKGLIPILIFSNGFIKKNEKQIDIIKFYPILFLHLESERECEQIKLVYNRKVYFAKKFKTFLERKKGKPRIKDEKFNKVVIIIVLPEEFSFYGSDLLKIVIKSIKKNFGHSLYQIIESEILKENLIKSPRIIEIIKKGEIIKENLKNHLKKIWKNYFDSIINSYEKNQLNFILEKKI